MKAKVRDRHGLEAIVDAARLDAISGAPGLGRLLSALRQPAVPEATCPACGWTSADLQRTALLGCGLCYSVFAETLRRNGYLQTS